MVLSKLPLKERSFPHSSQITLYINLNHLWKTSFKNQTTMNRLLTVSLMQTVTLLPSSSLLIALRRSLTLKASYSLSLWMTCFFITNSLFKVTHQCRLFRKQAPQIRRLQIRFSNHLNWGIRDSMGFQIPISAPAISWTMSRPKLLSRKATLGIPWTMVCMLTNNRRIS